MRTNLKERNRIREKFTGKIEKYGTKKAYRGDFYEKTILLKDVKDEDGKTLTDHLWFSWNQGFECLGELKKGEEIEFIARVKSYMKGRWCDEFYKDYKLNYPTKIRKI